jgi:hypothetical protein
MKKFVVYFIYFYVLLSKGYGIHPTLALDKGPFHISSCTQLQATAVQIDNVAADPDIDLRLKFLLLQAK